MTQSFPKLQRAVVLIGFCVVLLVAGAGCQTFRAADDDLSQTERHDDSRVGEVVAAVATAAVVITEIIALVAAGTR